MSGSSRSLQSCHFSGLRVSRTEFTPEHSKNGKNYSAKLAITAYMNIASKANGGKGTNDLLNLTLWGKRAHGAAKSMSPGKEFSCDAALNIFNKKVFKKSLVEGQPGVQVMHDDGSPIMVQQCSFTIKGFSYGEESDTQIKNELGATNADGTPVRPADWRVFGSPGEAAWKAILQARQATQFNPALAMYGFARVRMPFGEFGDYNPTLNQNQAPGATPDTQAAVAATFAGVNPAPVATPIAQPMAAQPAAIVPAPIVPAAIAQPVVNTGGFVVPGV